MPVADGFELIRAIRRASATPIVVLSVRGADVDKIRALDLGADDFVTKPFSVPELLARAPRPAPQERRRPGPDGPRVRRPLDRPRAAARRPEAAR